MINTKKSFLNYISYEKENIKFPPLKLRLKIDPVSYP